jgi:hypothetical protein
MNGRLTTEDINQIADKIGKPLEMVNTQIAELSKRFDNVSKELNEKHLHWTRKYDEVLGLVDKYECVALDARSDANEAKKLIADTEKRIEGYFKMCRENEAARVKEIAGDVVKASLKSERVPRFISIILGAAIIGASVFTAGATLLDKSRDNDILIKRLELIERRIP